MREQILLTVIKFTKESLIIHGHHRYNTDAERKKPSPSFEPSDCTYPEGSQLEIEPQSKNLKHS